MRAVIGIDRKLKRAWLDALLDHLARTQDQDALRTYLDEVLREELPGGASRAKSAGIALRIWGGVPADRVPLRERALEVLPTIGGGERLWLHWGMTALAYPFFRDVAGVVGRMLALQEDFTTAQVQERVLKTWGDRATTKEAAQKLLTTLVDWEVLRATKAKGHFLAVNRRTTGSTALQLWLLEALLKASPSEEIEAQRLLRLPEAFPFSLSIAVSDLRGHDRLSLHRQGLDMDMVAMAPSRAPAPRPAKRTPKKKAGIETPSLFGRLPEETIHGREDGTVRISRPRADGQPEEPVLEAVPLIPAARGQPDPLGPLIEEPVTPGVPTSCRDPIPEAGWVPRGPLSSPMRECLLLYRDGLDFGCIALTHSLIEAALRLVCRVRLGPRQAKSIDIRSQFAALSAIGVLPVPLKTRLDQSWLERVDFQEICPSSPADRGKLERVAESHLRLLIDLERQFFGSSTEQGRKPPPHPEHGNPEKNTNRGVS
jgi:hypothetical protein